VTSKMICLPCPRAP